MLMKNIPDFLYKLGNQSSSPVVAPENLQLADVVQNT